MNVILDGLGLIDLGIESKSNLLKKKKEIMVCMMWEGCVQRSMVRIVVAQKMNKREEEREIKVLRLLPND